MKKNGWLLRKQAAGKRRTEKKEVWTNGRVGRDEAMMCGIMIVMILQTPKYRSKRGKERGHRNKTRD